MTPYTTIKSPAFSEFIEKRSRFIGLASQISTDKEALELLSEIKSEHPGARHNCFAYALKSGVQRFSDDGEPQGTAGLPILEVLRRENILDGIIIVTRYFGGVLLGAPGLLRAYSRAAKLALDTAGTVMLRPCRILEISAPYSFYNQISRLFQDSEAVVLSSDFSENVRLSVRVPTELSKSVEERIRELSGNKAVLKATGETFA